MNARNKPVQTVFKVAAYLRVSTEEQADSHLGLEAQLKRIRGMADSKGWELDSIYSDDGVSGTIAISERENGARLLQDIKDGVITVVITTSIDRIGRDVLHVLKFIDTTKERIQLISCKESLDTTTAFGRAMLQMALVFAELEVGLVSERTIAALNAKGERDGIKSGLPPYGYAHEYSPKKGLDISIDAQKAEVVRMVFDLRKDGLTLRAIAQQVPVSFNTCKRILDNEQVYKGGIRGDSSHTWPVILK